VRTKAEVAVERAGIPTLREAFNRDMQWRRNRGGEFGGALHASTDKGYCRTFENHLAPWADQKVDVIDTVAIQAMLDDLSETAPFAAHKVNVVVGFAFDRAARMIKSPLPVLVPSLERNPKMQQRDIDHSVAWFDRWAQIEQVENEHKRLCWIVRWHTGMRGEMLRPLTWSNVDLDAGTMTIETGLKHAKGDGKRVIAMSTRVQELFRRLWEIRMDDCDWVFPSRRVVGSQRGHLDALDRLSLTAEGDLRHLWNVATHDVETREMVLHWLCGQSLAKGEQKNLGSTAWSRSIASAR
jgi:hypothetical protein